MYAGESRPVSMAVVEPSSMATLIKFEVIQIANSETVLWGTLLNIAHNFFHALYKASRQNLKETTKQLYAHLKMALSGKTLLL